MLLTDVAIRNRTTVAVLGLLIVFLGVTSYVTLPREAAPDIPIPYILVTTTYEGVSPEDIETSVTMKIEKELNGIRGVEEITSSSAEGMSLISVEFDPDVPSDVALQRVRDRVDLAKGELPQEAEEPVITEINIAELPIVLISVSGDLSPVQLKGIADELQDTLEAVPGVLKVEMAGDLEREIRLEFDPERLAEYNLTIPEILALIPSENVNISAGGLETPGTKFNVRIPAEFVAPEDVDTLILTVREGKPIYLADVASVRYTFKDRLTYSRLDGADTITLSVSKRVGSNAVRVSDYVKAVVAEAQRRVPPSVKFSVTYDMSDMVRSMVADLENNIAAALILVTVVLLLFLGWRPSTIVAMIIPLSMLITFFVVQALGYTLNMIVLYSLILVLGMLVDNAIVIVENIYRHLELGYRRIDAAILGAREVAWPVVTSTFTTVCAFLPMIRWPGVMGDFMKYLPITLTVGLLASLFVGLVFNPVICSVWATRRPKRHRGEHWFIRGYRRFQEAGLRNPRVTLFLAICLLVGLMMLYGKIGEGIEFFPDTDPERAVINIRAPQGTNLQETDRIARLIEERLEPFTPWLEHVITNVGSASGGTLNLIASAGGSHLGSITLVFYDYAERERPSKEVIAEVRQAVADIAGAEIRVEQEEAGPPSGAAVEVRVIGEDFKTLERLSEQAKRMIAPVPNLVNLRSDFEAARPELAFTVDRRVAMLTGVNTATVGNFLKMAIFGSKVGTYREFNDEYDISVRLPLKDRTQVDDLYRLQIPNQAGDAVPLSSLGSLTYQGGLGTINRVDQKRVITLTADVEGRLSTEVLADVQKRLRPLGDPRLTEGDVLDWTALRETLKRGQTQASSPAGRVWDVLTSQDGPFWTKAPISGDDLASLLSAPTFAGEQKERLLSLLNQALSDPQLYRADAFPGPNLLPAQAVSMLERGPENLTNVETTFLTREALVSAWPDVIAPNERLELPLGYELRYVGEQEEQEKAQAFLSKALVIALLLVVMVLVVQFNSLIIPVIIMTTVVLSFVGALMGLLVCGLPFGVIMTGVGVISLAGVVVNNAIVLLAYTRQLQAEGKDLIAAASEAGVTRLRPVLLTAATTVIGLIPMAVGISYDFHTFSWATKSESTEWWRNMAVVIIFGLAFATVLTLVVVPSLYVMLTRFADRVMKALGWGKAETAQSAPPEADAAMN
ncbi:MAG: efflux RND transporter permease subunit [Sedimentisphaerales bacterium]|nr:efflux RND transporter permease subunit [Sedimentisphaerales bacterium]